MKHLLVYGTLRNGEYNFNRFGGQTFLRKTEVEGFQLFDCGLPRVIKGEGKLVVELHEVEDKPADYIHQMELGAGYEEVKISLPEGEASLYFCDESTVNRGQGKRVESGDWITHLKEKKPNKTDW